MYNPTSPHKARTFPNRIDGLRVVKKIKKMYTEIADYDKMTTKAIELKFAVVLAGGMATKSFIENWLMLHHEGLCSYDARSITNDIEFYQKDRNFKTDKTLSDFPGVVLIGRTKRAEISTVTNES